jgi:tmRNA-binding protein
MAATIISDNYESCIMDFVLARGKKNINKKMCIKDKQKKRKKWKIVTQKRESYSSGNGKFSFLSISC